MTSEGVFKLSSQFLLRVSASESQLVSKFSLTELFHDVGGPSRHGGFFQTGLKGSIPISEPIQVKERQ